MAGRKQRKEEWVTIRVTPAQKAAIVKAARRLGLDPGTFARMVVLGQTEYDPERDEPKTG